MTNEEAIKALKLLNLRGAHPFLHWEEMQEVRDMAIQALEKQISKDPLVYDTENTMMYELPWDDSWGYECPCCGNRDIEYGHMFCECGQALKWE